MRPDHNDYNSTAEWMVACVIASNIETFGLAGSVPSPEAITQAVVGANSGSSLIAYIAAAWDAASEVAYDMFPQFNDPDEETA